MRWPFPTSKLSLGEQDVHVWCASLADPECAAAPVEHTLSADERRRAEQFVHEHHRLRFIAGRGMLRTILGAYLHAPPASLSFEYNPSGKPTLTRRGKERIEFNLSHSHELVLYAVTRGTPVGVDIEHVRPLSEYQSIAAAFFTEHENRCLRSLPPNQQLLAFFRIWTRKESYLKATGQGIGDSLRSVEVSSGAGELMRPLPVKAADDRPWRLVELDAAPGYVASLAVADHHLNIRCMRWPQLDAAHSRPFVSDALGDQLN